MLGYSAHLRMCTSPTRSDKIYLSQVGEMYPSWILTQTKGVQILESIYPKSLSKSRPRFRRVRILVRTKDNSNSDPDPIDTESVEQELEDGDQLEHMFGESPITTRLSGPQEPRAIKAHLGRV